MLGLNTLAGIVLSALVIALIISEVRLYKKRRDKDIVIGAKDGKFTLVDKD